MALELVLEKVDGLADPIKALYKEKDGKFHLDVSGVEDTTGLKSALAREKEDAKKFKAENAAFRALGMSAEEIKALKDAKEAADIEAGKKAGNFDALLKQHTDKWTGEKTELQKKLDETTSWGRKAVIDSGISAALAKAKVTEEGIGLLMQVLPARVKFDLQDGTPHIEILQADGKTPLAGSGANAAATYDDLVKEAIKTYPSLFEGTGAGGGGASNRGGRGAGSKTILRSEFDKLDPSIRHQRIVKEGFTVVDS